MVSILVPAYNAAPWLGAALPSALAQTWRRTEVIVVDDGSTDETFAVAHQFGGPRCRILRQPHQGAAAARNRAYQAAHGDFIQFLDADDWLAPTKIEIQVRAASAEEEDALTFSSITHFYDSSPRPSITHPARLENFEENPVDFLTALWNAPAGSLVQTGQWLVPRLLMERAGRWDESLTVDDDGEFFARVILASSRLVPVPDSLAYYRKFQQGANLSARPDFESAMRAAQLKCLALLKHAENQQARAAVQKVITREILRAYPAHPESAQAGLDFLHRHHLVLNKTLEGSPWFRRLRRVLGWRLARQLQQRFRGWRNKLSAPIADALPSARRPEEASPHPPERWPSAGHCNPPHASARPQA